MNNSFPPPYTIRISKRAKNPRLRIRADFGLEVVLPKNSLYDPALLVAEKKDWILKHYSRIIHSEKKFPPREFPTGIFLFGATRFYHFQPTSPTQEHIHTLLERYLPGVVPPRVIETEFLPITQNEKYPYRYIQTWVKNIAISIFKPMLFSLGEQYSLQPTNCRFKLQRTRWGSCSSKKNINLNTCLAFLPPNLAKYILVHELCHLAELNHSQLYWKKVFAIEPRALEYDKSLRSAWKYIPPWIFTK